MAEPDPNTENRDTETLYNLAARAERQRNPGRAEALHDEIERRLRKAKLLMETRRLLSDAEARGLTDTKEYQTLQREHSTQIENAPIIDRTVHDEVVDEWEIPPDVVDELDENQVDVVKSKLEALSKLRARREAFPGRDKQSRTDAFGEEMIEDAKAKLREIARGVGLPETALLPEAGGVGSRQAEAGNGNGNGDGLDVDAEARRRISTLEGQIEATEERIREHREEGDEFSARYEEGHLAQKQAELAALHPDRDGREAANHGKETLDEYAAEYREQGNETAASKMEEQAVAVHEVADSVEGSGA